MDRYSKEDAMKALVIVLAVIVPVAALSATAGAIVKSIQFDIAIGDRMKRAADANTVETATKEMDAVVAAIEERGLTSGYTSVFYRTPDEDMGFWYTNLKQARDELHSIRSDSPPLERSNMLMKLRETILDAGESGDHVTVPSGISRYPNNLGWGVALWLLWLLTAAEIVAVFVEYA